ncbi:RNA 2',3'-cyclic phosphodiesterase [Pseudomonas oryzae]|uniref:RNA 2',3'-cyclic phosphodiesterase n=1 Tax=Pseudomonas oryzae TaxID=1392877 RepID=A0A1H1WS30_9PSED|nr:RNA 2',3'-cyclic phosphodiesterase [Pseudomonas oryzae]SDS99842.1 2'-5' RNA ligase [Pseudomonas oryzae]
MPIDTLRLFFALPCPRDTAEAICTWRDGLDLGGKPVAAENLHLTLAFLGQQPSARLEELQLLAAAIEVAPFELRLDRLGGGRQGLLWLEPSHLPDELAALAGALQQRLQAIGIALDRRPLRAHLTLVRHAGARPREAHPDFAWAAERFVLYASEPSARGVRYRELGGWPLVPGLPPLPRFRTEPCPPR